MDNLFQVKKTGENEWTVFSVTKEGFYISIAIFFSVILLNEFLKILGVEEIA